MFLFDLFIQDETIKWFDLCLPVWLKPFPFSFHSSGSDRYPVNKFKEKGGGVLIRLCVSWCQESLAWNHCVNKLYGGTHYRLYLHLLYPVFKIQDTDPNALFWVLNLLFPTTSSQSHVSLLVSSKCLQTLPCRSAPYTKCSIFTGTEQVGTIEKL